MISIVNGTSTLSLVAGSVETLNQAINFYTNILGLSVHSEQNDWTYLSNDDNKMIVKIQLDTKSGLSLDQINDRRTEIIAKLNITDWRSLDTTSVLKVQNLVALIETLTTFNYTLQITPNELYPNEVYCVDPLGYIIGFTACDEPLTLVPPLQKSHPKPGLVSNLMSKSGSQSRNIEETKAVRRNIAVMTSGGDSQGMNAAVRAVVRATIFHGSKAFAVQEGYAGLVKGGPEYIKEMKWQDVRGFLSEGGTNIGTARCMEFKERWGRLKGCKNLIDAGIDGLIVCGGDGSLTGADLFRHEWPSLIQELKDKVKSPMNNLKDTNTCTFVVWWVPLIMIWP